MSNTATLPVLVPLAPGFEEIEFTSIVDVLRRLGIGTCTAGLTARRQEGAHGITMEADMLLVDVDASLFSALVIPGGMASWTLRDTPAIIKLAKQMAADGKTVAAICAAPMVLAKAGLLEGKQATCYPADEVTESLQQAGATLSEAPAVVDGNIITGRGPATALEFALTVGEHLLGSSEAVTELRQGMCCS